MIDLKFQISKAENKEEKTQLRWRMIFFKLIIKHQKDSEKHLAIGDLKSIGGAKIFEQLEEDYQEQDIKSQFNNAR